MKEPVQREGMCRQTWLVPGPISKCPKDHTQQRQVNSRRSLTSTVGIYNRTLVTWDCWPSSSFQGHLQKARTGPSCSPQFRTPASVPVPSRALWSIDGWNIKKLLISPDQHHFILFLRITSYHMGSLHYDKILVSQLLWRSSRGRHHYIEFLSMTALIWTEFTVWQSLSLSSDSYILAIPSSQVSLSLELRWIRYP